MGDVSSGEDLCTKISGCPTAWKKPGCFLFPQLSEVLSYLVTASLVFSSPHAKALPTAAGKAKDTAESTKLSPVWVRHPPTTILARLLCTQHLILRALPWVTSCLHPFFPSKSGSGTCLQPLLLRGWWHMSGGVGLSRWERVPGAMGVWKPPT